MAWAFTRLRLHGVCRYHRNVDASLVLQLVAKKIEPTAPSIIYRAADVNSGGEVTAQDASLILQYVAKKITW